MNARKPGFAKKYLREVADIYKDTEIKKSVVGAIIGRLNAMLGGDQNRRRLLARIFRDDVEELHRADTKPGEWMAVYEWMGFYEEDGVWETSPTFKMELKMMCSIMGMEIME